MLFYKDSTLNTLYILYAFGSLSLDVCLLTGCNTQNAWINLDLNFLFGLGIMYLFG